MIKPGVEGSVRTGLRIQWQAESDGTPTDITGTTISAVLKELQAMTSRVATGAFTVVDGPNGIFTWDQTPADVMPLAYAVQFTAVYPLGATPNKSFQTSWWVEPCLVVV